MNMPFKDPEKRKEYCEKNKEKKKEYDKKYRETNLQKIKKYRENNKEKIKEKRQEHYKNNLEKLKKKIFMNRYKMLVDCDLEVLYKNYLAETHCDFCCMPFTAKNDPKYKNKYVKCLDHCHDTNKFRNFLCLSCNSKRK